MARRKKISRDELRQPDEFITIADRTISYIIANQSKFIAILAVVAVAVAAFAGSRYYIGWQRAKATAALEAAMDKLKTAPEGGSEMEKAREMLAQVAADYAGYKSAEYANYYLGNLFYKQKDYEKAIGYYKKTLKKSGRQNKAVHEMAILGIGYSYEASGGCRQSIDFFENLTATGGALVKDNASLSMARCYEATGDYQKAYDTYKYVVENYPNSPSLVDLKDKMDRLEDKLKSKKD